jgi:hypothetical protein
LNDIFYVEVTYEIEHVQKIDTISMYIMRWKGNDMNIWNPIYVLIK